MWSWRPGRHKSFLEPSRCGCSVQEGTSPSWSCRCGPDDEGSAEPARRRDSPDLGHLVSSSCCQVPSPLIRMKIDE
eukprot:2481979-Amphidinium_carterae.1